MSDNLFTPRGIASYPNLLKPYKSNIPDAVDKHSVALMVKKDKDISAISNAVYAVLSSPEGMSKIGITAADLQNLPPALKLPIKDGDDPHINRKNPEYKGHWIIKATSTPKPGGRIFMGYDEAGKLITAPLEDESKVYPGVEMIISVRAFAYNRNGGFGVSLGLQNYLITDTSKPSLGNRKTADEDFANAPADLPDASEIAQNQATTDAALAGALQEVAPATPVLPAGAVAPNVQTAAAPAVAGGGLPWGSSPPPAGGGMPGLTPPADNGGGLK